MVIELNKDKEVEQKGINIYSKKYGNGAAWSRGAMIGKGSYGCVFLATLKKPKSKFSCFPCVMAVKSAEVSVSGSIQKEREVLSNVGRCGYVIRCFGEETTIGENGEMVYNLLLEYGSGGTLADFIKKSGGAGNGLEESVVRRYTKDLLQGISHIHDQGYVHCDLKPENVLLVPNTRNANGGGFRAKIGDLGLAKRGCNQSKKRKLEPYWRGTPMYLSPEAVIESVQEAPSDIWALGCIVLEMLTGKPAWDGDYDTDELLRRIGEGGESPKIPNELSIEAKNFLKGCFARNTRFRLTADMLLSAPFVDGLRNDDEDEEKKEDIADVSTVSSLLLLSDADDYDDDDDDEFSSSFSEEDCSFLSDEDCVSYWSEEETSSEKVTAFAEDRTSEVQESRDNTSSIQAPSNSREKYLIAFTIPAGV